MTFEATLRQNYPGALLAQDFVVRTQQALAEYGFNRENALACVAVCRDEITRPLVDLIQSAWGEAFNFSSLAGMLFLGRTGFQAALHHAPQVDGRTRYVFFALPHIAIGPQGEIGVIYRPGRAEPSGACGALLAFQHELSEDTVNLEPDPEDLEQIYLKRRLFSLVPLGPAPDLLALTQMAYTVLLEDLEGAIARLIDPQRSNWVVLGGIQIHGPQTQYVWPGKLYASLSGQRQDISISA